MKPKGRKYYVIHLSLDDPRRGMRKIYQVQIVDKYGRATALGYLSEDQNELMLGNEKIPLEVIQSVKSLPPGTGDFVDESGKQVLPKDLPFS